MKNKIYHILISFALALMLTTAYMTHDTHASSAEYTIKVCERNFIGYNYNSRVEKKCDLLFRKWTYEILNTYQ